MIRFGVIGTSWITEELIRCARLHPDFQLTAVYSRSEEKARSFADKHCAQYVFTDLVEMAKSGVIDAVYIASPNSLHAEQAILFLDHHKHVLCEKPVSANLPELKAMIAAAKRNGVALMEAMKSTMEPGMQVVRRAIPKLGRIRRFFGSYCQYSSRYDAYKAGKYNNTFNPDFANGALMDLGVYCIYPLVYLFGKPESVQANAVFLPSGVDGETSLLCKYKDMDAVLMFSKITASRLPSEIQGETGTLSFFSINEVREAEIFYHASKSSEKLEFAASNDLMYYEVKDFIEVIQSGRIESSYNSFNLALNVKQVMDEVRRQIGLHFKNDDRKVCNEAD